MHTYKKYFKISDYYSFNIFWFDLDLGKRALIVLYINYFFKR